MTFPYLLCLAAVAAAVLAATIGRLCSASERARRAQRRRWDALRVHRYRIAGQLATDRGSWQRWWAERAAAGLDDELDVLRGGA